MDDAHQLSAIYQQVIRSAVRDIARCCGADYESAKTYINGPVIEQHQKMSGYPAEVVDTLRQMMVASPVERAIMALEILEILGEFQDKKNPPKRGI